MVKLFCNLRHAIDRQAAEPSLALTLIISLAVALGANAAVSGLMDSLFFCGPSVTDAENLALVAGPDEGRLHFALQTPLCNLRAPSHLIQLQNRCVSTDRMCTGVDHNKCTLPALSMPPTPNPAAKRRLGWSRKSVSPSYLSQSAS